MVMHEDPRMHGKAVARSCVTYAAIEHLEIFVAGKNRIPVVPANDNMLWLPGQEQPWLSRHHDLRVMVV